MKKTDLNKIKLPDKPGVYLFKGPTSSKTGSGKRGSILYIGKATSLRDRVRSYFGVDLIETRSMLLVDMITKAKKVEAIETNSVLEALILEANLIKKHQPKYNTKEKDDKSFNYVGITKEEFPQVLIVRGKDIKIYSKIRTNFRIDVMYGPFPRGRVLKEALKIIRKIFPFRDKASSQKDKERFYRQIGLAPDLTDANAQKEYKKTIRNIKLFFEGSQKELIKNLENEMNKLAEKKKFEEAGRIRNQIFALTHIQDVALIKEDPYTNILTNVSIRVEAYDVAHISGKNMAGVMVVIEDGEIQTKEYRKFRIKGFDSSNDVGALKEILERRFAHPEWHAPRLIVVDGGKAQKNAAESVMKKIGLPIDVVAVIKDEKHRPKEILGKKKLIEKTENSILLANSEAHRFALSFHRSLRRKAMK